MKKTLLFPGPLLTILLIIAAGNLAVAADVTDALKKRADVQFIDTPLRDTIEFLKDAANVTIILDENVLNSAGIGTDVPITFNEVDLSLEEALHRILDPLDLVWVVEDDLIRISHAIALEPKTIVYKIGDLVDGPLSEEAISEVIRRTVAPGTWGPFPDRVKATEPTNAAIGIGRVVVTPNGLVIHHSPLVHREVATLIDNLRLWQQQPAGVGLVQMIAQNSEPEPPAKELSPAEIWEALEKIRNRRRLSRRDSNGGRRDSNLHVEKALREPTEIEFIDTPLRDVLTFLKDFHNVSIWVNETALDNAGIPTDPPISLVIKGVSFRSGLKILLDSVGLTWRLSLGGIEITTPAAIKANQTVHVYDLRGLAETAVPLGELPACLQATIAPEEWKTSRLGVAIGQLPGCLVIRQSSTVHSELQQFFEKLEVAALELNPDPAPAAQREAAIRHALAQKIPVEFIDTPIWDAMNFLSDTLNIPIVFDDSAHAFGSEPITLNIQNASLKTILSLMLKPFSLDWEIADEVLMIRTRQETAAARTTDIFPIRELRQDGMTRDQIRELVHSIDPPTWEQTGQDTESITLGNWIVIRQNPKNLEKIATLLKEVHQP